MAGLGDQEADFAALMADLARFRTKELEGQPSERRLAEAAGVSPTTLGAWLRDNRFPQVVDPVLKLVKAVRTQALGAGKAAQAASTLFDQQRWKDAYTAEAQRRAAGTRNAVEAAQGRAALQRLRPGRLVGECDPLMLEVKPAIQVPGTEPTGTLPSYALRSHDVQLRELVDVMLADGRSRLVTLVGGSSTGKTRAAWELALYLQQQCPGRWRLWHPFDPTRPQAVLADLTKVGPETIVWLNEAQHYLMPLDPVLGERVAAGLRALLSDLSEPGRGPVLILATLWPDYWTTLITRPRTGQPDLYGQGRDLLTFGTKVRVGDTFTDDELASLTGVGVDARLRYAAAHVNDGRIIQYVAGVPALEERYQEAPPAAKAILQVAMDARRLGYPLALPHALLEHAAFGYLDKDEWDFPGGDLYDWGDDWFEQALAYATVRLTGARGPLTRIRARPGDPPPRGGPCYRLADYLEQLGRAERGGTYPPGSLWEAFASNLPGPGALLALAEEAENRGRFRHAAALLAEGASGGDRESAARLARLLQRRGRADEAYPWWRSAAEAGDVTAMVTVGAHLESQGDADGAIRWWTAAADAGSQEAPCRIAYHLHAAGREDDARDWWRRANAANGGEYYWANRTVMDFLLREDRSDEAMAWAPQRMSYSGGMTRWPELARLLHRQGRTHESISYWKEYIENTSPDDADHVTALRQATTAMLDAGQTDQMIAWLRDRAELGYEEGKHELVRRLAEGGRVDEAVTWLTDYAARHPCANDDTAGRVADLLLADGRADDALAALHRAAAAGDPAALGRAVAMMQAAGRSQQAFDWLAGSGPQSPTNAPTTRVLCLMARALRAAGHCSLALLLLQEVAEALGGPFFGLFFRDADITPARALQMWDDAYAGLHAGDLAIATFHVDDAGAYPDLLRRLAAPGTEAGDQRKSAAGAALVSEEVDARQVADWLRTRSAENGSGAPRSDRAARLAARSGFEAEALAIYERLGLTYQQAELLEKMGRIDDVVDLWLGSGGGIGPNDFFVGRSIAELLYRTRGIEEAVAFIRHDHSAVARLYAEAGYHREAITAWRLSADHGSRDALDEVVALLHHHGEPHSARHLQLYGWEADGTDAAPWAAPHLPTPSDFSP